MARLDFLSAANAQSQLLSIQVSDVTGAPLSAQAVEVTFTNIEKGIELISYPATCLDQGQWQVQPLTLPDLSRWQVHVRILVSDFDRLILQTGFTFTSSMESK